MNQDADRVSWALEVARAIEELPAAERSVVRLAYFEQLSQARIAERLSLSKREVSGVLAAGMSRLTALLGLTTAS
ncbi:MAG: Sigma-70, region 4 [Pseudonocardiales bacterium]|nr:Sigma-70, region 4 [Pseudonocardiales bacterium]MDT4909710.1 Sigma-70, region 4 [Pseudonocardiales bacterium]MDT4958972.1 Sigma-70, region 4 [Pseudonocardiales bacterium]MDT4961215.1 Sigma-70, region 4 [Pseudonocardiales bacterium]MDT4973478.1 Sigma-70, region 4 [Pseudonocardiales bacterium]